MGRKKGIHRPTPRARKLLRHLAAGKSHAEAAVLAGYSPKNAAQSAYQALECLSKSFPQLMDEAGITDVALIKRYLLPLISAKRTIYFHHKGKVRDKRVVEALDTRLGSLELAFRLKGSFAPVKTEQHSRNVTTIILDVPRPPRPGPNGEPPGNEPIEVKPINSNGHKPREK